MSWSSLTTYESCPLRYRLKYVDGAPPDAAPPAAPMALGSAMHSALEAFYGDAARRGRAAGDVRAARRALESAALAPEQREEAARLLSEFAAREAGRAGRVLAVERPFRIVLANGVPFTGIIDRIDRAPFGRVSVTDYKSGATTPGMWLARRSGQLGFYQMGAEAGLGLDVDHLAVEHLRTGLRFTSSPRSPPELEELTDRAGRAFDAIAARDFPARPGRDCACEFARRCPYYSDLYPKVEDWSGEERRRAAALVARYAATRDPEARADLEAYMRESGVRRAWGETHVVERSPGGLLLVRERAELSPS